MTPTVTSERTYSEDHLTLTNKLRKPQVEKLRRDRINSSIEQLLSLLGPELLNQQPDSKLEKADILEMTVSLLSRLQPISPSSCSAPTNQGHSRCVQETVHFLSKEQMETETQRKLLSHFQSLQSSPEKNRRETNLPQLSSPALYSISKEKMPINSAPWRPW